ncbi:hypothetical protein E2C01_017441 [Portunus trituberculatus]|uniref:Uncharacterized protein n=1 Tax=Portunus trituberculatus TaxID=210409 RepID=A0A5B7DRW0_PORTR|nr:hypothetical protein [Portunus trituberculatus]
MLWRKGRHRLQRWRQQWSWQQQLQYDFLPQFSLHGQLLGLVTTVS